MSGFTDNLQHPSFHIPGEGTDLNMQLSMWNGFCSLSIYKGQKISEPIFKETVTFDLIEILIQELSKLQQEAPGTKRPIVVQDWNDEEKKMKTIYVLDLQKDDKSIVKIRVLFKTKNGEEYSPTFILRIANKYAIGPDPMKDGDRSNIKLKQLIKFLDRTTQQAWITRQKPQRRDGGGNSYGGNKGGYSKGGGYNKGNYNKNNYNNSNNDGGNSDASDSSDDDSSDSGADDSSLYF